MKIVGILGMTLTSLAALGAANAADIYRGPAGAPAYTPAYAVVNWSGFYAGINGGGAWSDSSDQLADPIVGGGGVSPSGGFGGGQIGYNWQGIWHPHLVLGIEADIQGAGVSDKTTDAAGFGNSYKSSLDYFGTVRGRVGYAIDASLVYFTGGFAYGGVRNKATLNDTIPTSVALSKDTTATGYVLGAGWEYKFSPAWSAKVEYQYINLGKNDPADGFGNTFSGLGGTVHDDAYHTVRVGLNYFVSPGYSPLK